MDELNDDDDDDDDVFLYVLRVRFCNKIINVLTVGAVAVRADPVVSDTSHLPNCRLC